MVSSKIQVGFIWLDNSRKAYKWGASCWEPACKSTAVCSGAVLGANWFVKTTQASWKSCWAPPASSALPCPTAALPIPNARVFWASQRPHSPCLSPHTPLKPPGSLATCSCRYECHVCPLGARSPKLPLYTQGLFPCTHRHAWGDSATSPHTVMDILLNKTGNWRQPQALECRCPAWNTK